MRSKLLACAAIAVLCVYACPRFAQAAKPKAAKQEKADGKADSKKSPLELHADDKSMKRQMQWEDKVMGPDSTKADLQALARARAVNEKATKEREAQAAREAASPPPPVMKAAPAKRADVALPAVNDGAAPSKSAEPNHTQISAKLMSDEAKAAPTPVKPADDKFIEKLLRDEQVAAHSRKGSASDRDLDKLLAGANEPKHRGRGDEVDSLIKNKDSGPAMPAPRAEAALPAWTQQPDIPSRPSVSAPPVSPLAAKPVKRDDGVIRVVQGATGVAPVAAPPPSRTSPTRGTATRSPTARSVAPASDWADPFADSSAVATRDTSSSRRAPASHPSAASTWNDPFADKPTTSSKTTGRAAPTTPAAAPKRGEKSVDPAHGPGWKDPFTKGPYAGPASPKLAVRESASPKSAVRESAAKLAVREPAPKSAVREPAPLKLAVREPAHVESARWEPAARRPARAPITETGASSHLGWGGVLKKRAR